MIYPIVIGYAIGRLVAGLVMIAVLIVKGLVAGLARIIQTCLTKR
jgi:hypothetical protein